ncbi:MAG TPA: protein kinase, partial [Myxococcota bacterium]
NGKLCIAYGDPEIATRADSLGLPKHQAYLALRPDLQKALALLPDTVPPTDDESNLFDDGPRDADDGATIVNRPIPVSSDSSADGADGDIDASEVAAAISPSLAAAATADDIDGDDDPVLFDDPTTALAAPPSMPKPTRPQAQLASPAPPESSKAPATTPGRPSGERPHRAQPAQHDTLVTAPVSAAAVAAPARPKPKQAVVVDADIPPTAVTSRRAPSLATPSHGSTQTATSTGSNPSMGISADMAPKETVLTATASKVAREHRGLRDGVGAAELGAVDAAPVETVRTALPKPGALANARNHPANHPAGRATVDDATMRTDPVQPGAPLLASAKTAQKAAKPTPTSARPQPAARPASPVESTQVRALRELSLDDLESDDAEPVVELPPPAVTQNGTRAVAPAHSSSDSADAADAADAAEAAAAAQHAESPSSQGAFASAESAPDQEVVQNQKQRLKRIAQIASVKRYKIDRVLGRGGMATVYYATDTKTGQPCALKLMEPHLADDAVFVERFKREIRASTSLNHENIVRVFDYGEEGGTYYMASEYVDGGTVASLLKSADRPMPVSIVVPIMLGFLDGLEAAHAQGFVHRDLKPANLMLTKKGVIKI